MPFKALWSNLSGVRRNSKGEARQKCKHFCELRTQNKNKGVQVASREQEIRSSMSLQVASPLGKGQGEQRPGSSQGLGFGHGPAVSAEKELRAFWSHTGPHWKQPLGITAVVTEPCAPLLPSSF